jgi:hypothetical protein
MKIGTKLLPLVLASVMIGTVAINQVYAPRFCDGCTEFKKLTHDFEKAVIVGVEVPEN